MNYWVVNGNMWYFIKYSNSTKLLSKRHSQLFTGMSAIRNVIRLRTRQISKQIINCMLLSSSLTIVCLIMLITLFSSFLYSEYAHPLI